MLDLVVGKSQVPSDEICQNCPAKWNNCSNAAVAGVIYAASLHSDVITWRAECSTAWSTKMA